MPECWNCDTPIQGEEGCTKYICKNCGVSNDFSVYTPLTEAEIKEIKMPFDNTQSKVKGSFIKLPKEGEQYDFSIHGEIEKIEKVENLDHKKSKFNFMKKVPFLDPSTNQPVRQNGQIVKIDEDQGYFYRITFADGSELKVSSWSPFFAMKEAEVMEGDKIIINHKTKGEWIITKV